MDWRGRPPSAQPWAFLVRGRDGMMLGEEWIETPPLCLPAAPNAQAEGIPQQPFVVPCATPVHDDSPPCRIKCFQVGSVGRWHNSRGAKAQAVPGFPCRARPLIHLHTNRLVEYEVAGGDCMPHTKKGMLVHVHLPSILVAECPDRGIGTSPDDLQLVHAPER